MKRTDTSFLDHCQRVCVKVAVGGLVGMTAAMFTGSISIDAFFSFLVVFIQAFVAPPLELDSIKPSEFESLTLSAFGRVTVVIESSLHTRG